MSILFNPYDESCLDPEGMKQRKLFGDRLIRVLLYLTRKGGTHPKILHLNNKNTILFEDQFGLNSTSIYGPMCECKIIKSGNR